MGNSSSDRASINELAERYHLDHAYLKELHQNLQKRYPSGFLSPKDLKEALNVHLCSDEMAQQLLKQFDSNGDKRLSIVEFLVGMVKMRYGTAQERFEYAFHVFDQNGNGHLDKEEVTTCVVALLLEKQDGSLMKMAEIMSLSKRLWKKLDKNGNGEVDMEEFQKIIGEDFTLREKIMALASLETYESKDK